MTFVEKIIYNIGSELGKDYTSMTPIVEILKNNYCDTKEALLSCSFDDLIEMGIPSFLSKRILSKLNFSLSLTDESIFDKKQSKQSQ